MYTAEHIFATPVVLGAFVGTFLAVAIDTWKTIDFIEFIDYITL